MSELALEEPENAIRKELFIWYFDQYLVAVLPREFWKEDIRCYKLLTDTIEIGGRQRVLVSVTSEAFGLLMWENCHQKWINYFRLKDEKGEKAKVPQGKEPGAEAHLAKWSDGTDGQVLYGGWKDEAYDRFEELKKEIKAWRKAEEESGKKGQALARKYMRLVHEKTGETPQEDKKSKRKKKTQVCPTYF